MRLIGRALNLLSALSIPAILAFGASAYGATLYVASNGTVPTNCAFVVFGSTCGTQTNPCRSIQCAIVKAAPGDTILVGPGRYGDLNGDGTLDDPGDEFGSSGCGCMLSINKPVKVWSTDGAAATVIDALAFPGNRNVLVIADGGELGKPAGGFLVTETADPHGNGIVIDAADFR